MQFQTIPEFTTLTKQQLFDRAIEHITATGVPSFDRANGSCCYQGSGCNAAPFLTEQGKKQGDGIGSWSLLVNRNLVPEHESTFVGELQAAHDRAYSRAARIVTDVDGMSFADADDSVTPELWRPHYAFNMRELASQYQLEPSKLFAFEEKYDVQSES